MRIKGTTTTTNNNNTPKYEVAKLIHRNLCDNYGVKDPRKSTDAPARSSHRGRSENTVGLQHKNRSSDSCIKTRYCSSQ